MSTAVYVVKVYECHPLGLTRFAVQITQATKVMFAQAGRSAVKVMFAQAGRSAVKVMFAQAGRSAVKGITAQQVMYYQTRRSPRYKVYAIRLHRSTCVLSAQLMYRRRNMYVRSRGKCKCIVNQEVSVQQMYVSVPPS